MASAEKETGTGVAEEKGSGKPGSASKNVTEVVEAIGNLTFIEVAELVKELEDRFGVTAAVPMAIAAAAPGAGAEVAVEEKTEFDVVLSAIGDKKIQVIKVVRAVTGLGLKEAKELVDNAPRPVKEGVTKEEAAEVKGKLEEVGASVEVK